MQHRTSISDGASGSGAQSMTGLPLDRFQRIEPDPESEVLRVLQRGNALFDRRGGREQLADAPGNAPGGPPLWQLARGHAAPAGQGIHHGAPSAPKSEEHTPELP